MTNSSVAKAWIGTILFLLVAPGVLAGLIPWLITGWRNGYWGGPLPLIFGMMLIAFGTGFVLTAFTRFVTEGRGTPAPIAPTEQLVIGGIYRYVRNPMYLAVASVILGQALLFGSWWLLIYAAAFMVTVFAFVHWYEEPTLLRTYAEEYERYRQNVPGWRPRVRPWKGDALDKS